MKARRIIAGIIVAVIALIAMGLFIATLYIPHINARVQQVSSSVILEPYGADLKFYLTKGTATNDYGEEVWVEDPYDSGIASALVFGRCPDALDDLKLVHRLVIACCCLCGAAALLALISMCCCGSAARCGTLALLFSFLATLASVGLMAWVAVLFFTVYDDHESCLTAFGTDLNFTDFTFAKKFEVAEKKGAFKAADEVGFLYATSNTTYGGNNGQFHYLRASGNVEYFETILTPDYQAVYSNLSSSDQFQFRRAVAIGAVGDIRVNDVRMAQGIRVLIAAWAVALIGALVGMVFLCTFCCCPSDSEFGQIKKRRSPTADDREMGTHTTITTTTTDFHPQMWNGGAANMQSASANPDFHAVDPHVQNSSVVATRRSPDAIHTQRNTPATAAPPTPLTPDQPYSYNPTPMPQERVHRGNHQHWAYSTQQQGRAAANTPNIQAQVTPAQLRTHHPVLPIGISPSPPRQQLAHTPPPRSSDWQPMASPNPTPIGCLSISSPTDVNASDRNTFQIPDQIADYTSPVMTRAGANMYEHNLRVWEQFRKKEEGGRRSGSASPAPSPRV